MILKIGFSLIEKELLSISKYKAFVDATVEKQANRKQPTIFQKKKKRFQPENKYQLWSSPARKRIKLQRPDWSHIKELLYLFKMRPIWGL